VKELYERIMITWETGMITTTQTLQAAENAAVHEGNFHHNRYQPT